MAVIEPPGLVHLEPEEYQRHPLHDDDRIWPETNCYVDLWVELLHSEQLDPIAPLAFLLSSDFDGEQWEFFKYPLEDLRAVYGIDVHEVNLWLPIEEHVERHLQLGHLLTLEVDSWYLPDTVGVSYRLTHQKSSLTPRMIDRASKTLRYFHNRGYYELSGEDYDGVLRVGHADTSLPPYAEVVNLSRRERPDSMTLRTRVDELIVQHLERRPTSNPIDRLSARIDADVEWLRTQDQERFHGYAFATLRQCGAWAEMASSFAAWLGDDELRVSVKSFTELAENAKICQFKLARAARGRAADLTGEYQTMSQCWIDAYQPLIDLYGST